MHMRIAEPRHCEPPAQIDDARTGPLEALEVGLGPAGHDTVAAQRQRLADA